MCGPARRSRAKVGKVLGLSGVRGVEDVGALVGDGVGEAIVSHGRGEQANTAVPMLLVVPGEELVQEVPGMRKRGEVAAGG